jgi:hypothetical protein
MNCIRGALFHRNLELMYQQGSKRGIFANHSTTSGLGTEVVYNGDLTFYATYMYTAHFCSSLRRVGKTGDGGKFVCTRALSQNPSNDNNNNNIVVYSLGSYNDFSFEKGIGDLYKGASIFTFDCKITFNTESVPPGVTTFKICVGDEKRDDYRTFSGTLPLTNVSHIDILKVDIEGGETSVIPALLASQLRPTLLLLETHFTDLRLLDVLYPLSRAGYVPYALEQNFFCPFCAEFALIYSPCSLTAV